jgi:hypothetical protein
MNANRNFNKNASSSKKPYCKVCHDAGKAESVYTSHCVKTYNINTGKTDTTCPTLLALECRYCYKSGHTVKFCPVLEENKKMDVERARDRARQQYHAQAQEEKREETKKFKNAYAALADDSDDEQQAPVIVRNEVVSVNEVDNFPALPKKSYSSIAATPRPVAVVVAPPPVVRKELQKKTLSWVEAQADDSDSDAEVYDSDSDVVEVVPASLPCYAPRSQYTDEDW